MLPLLICAFLLPSVALASSSAVATSAIVTTFTSTYHSTSKSFVSTSISITTGGSCGTQTLSDGATTTVCIGFANATPVPVYTDVVRTLTSTIESTIGYTTIYTTFSDDSASSSGPQSATQSLIEDETTSIISNSETAHNPISVGAPSAESATRVAVGSSGISSTSATVTSATSSTPDSYDSRSSNNVGLKVALAFAIFAGLLVLFFIAGYIIKRRRDKYRQQFSGATKPENLEKGGMKMFVAMTKLKDQKGTITTPASVESISDTSKHDVETFGANDDNDPPIMYATFQEHQTVRSVVPLNARLNEVEGLPRVKEYSKPNISSHELSPRQGVADQTKASTEAINAKTTAPIDEDNYEKCSNPFHEPPCSCRQSIIMQPGRRREYEALGPQKHGLQHHGQYEIQNSLLHETQGRQRFEIQGNPRYEADGRQRYEAQSRQLYEAQSNHLYEAEGRQLYEASGNPRYEMSATPNVGLEDASVGMAR